MGPLAVLVQFGLEEHALGLQQHQNLVDDHHGR
jgi:hypothetical protein